MKTGAKKTFDAVKFMDEQRDKLNEKDDNEIYRLSDNHKMAINQSIDQIGKGDFLTNEQSNQQIDEWLKNNLACGL
jgi:hypothetical protein